MRSAILAGSIAVGLLATGALARDHWESHLQEPPDRYNEYQVYEELYVETYNLLEALVLDLRSCLAKNDESEQLNCARDMVEIYGEQFDGLKD